VDFAHFGAVRQQGLEALTRRASEARVLDAKMAGIFVAAPQQLDVYVKSTAVDGFVRISVRHYVPLHLKANPGTAREPLERALEAALAAATRGERCQCGEPIWALGSALAAVGWSCFTCITGEARPSGDDYEICASSP
jgi:hypothetical protein